MNRTAVPRGAPVRGPDGSILDITDLPSPDTKRWVIRRKAIIVAAVRSGLISLEAVCSRYRLNPEELLSWQYYLDRYGFSALRTTKVQSYLRPGQHRKGPIFSELQDFPDQTALWEWDLLPSRRGMSSQARCNPE
jgi:hypothetical protein